MYTSGNIHMSFNFGEEIPIIKGVHQNQFYSYFGGLMHLVYDNLIVYCSLDPVLDIWYVILVIFMEIQWHLSTLKKEIWYAKFGLSNFGKTAVLVIYLYFMSIYAIICCPQAQGAIICVCI